MNRIHAKSLGIAFGLTGAFLYLGCILLMIAVGNGAIVTFFNSILHGLDVSTSLKKNKTSRFMQT